MVTAQYNPFAPGVHPHPSPRSERLRLESPVHWSEMMEAWVLSRYDDVVFVLTDPRFSADRRSAQNRFAEYVAEREEHFGPIGRAPTRLTTDPPDHTRLRKLGSK